MPEENKENQDLPSIEEAVGQPENLPSVEEFLEDHKSCPEGEYFCNDEKRCKPIPEGHKVLENGELVKEGTQILDDAEGNAHIEVKDIVPPWPELVQMVNDIRADIPDIPEIKYYDKELEAICEVIDQVKESIPVVPEVRYYEKELEELQKSIESIKESIPELPVWISKVTEVPDYTWIAQTFNTVDQRFNIVKDSLETVSEQISVELNNIVERADTEEFETRTDFKTIHDRVSDVKQGIYNQLKEQSDIIWKLQKKLKSNQKEFEIAFTDRVEGLVGEHQDITAETTKRLEEKFTAFGNRLDEEIGSLEDRVSQIPRPKYYEDELNEIRKELKGFGSLREVVEEIKAKQGDVAKFLEEGLLNEPPDVEQSLGPVNGPDPLTPLDQKFATLRDLQQHYRLFVNRVQQQLSTLGGGGTVWLSNLDDVGISTQTLQDGQSLTYNLDQDKWIAGTGVGAGGTWFTNSIGISTTKSVGIGTTTASANYELVVYGDMHATGNISAAGTVTYEDVTNLDVLGIGTFRDQVQVGAGLSVVGITTLGTGTGVGTVHVGVGTTALLVDGDARVIGILTVGRGSVTIDGNANEVTVGVVTVTNSTIILGENVTIDATASGINSAPNVLYVAKDGLDTNNGTSIDNAFLTIKGAVGIATTGTVIKVLAGNYTEANPIEVPAFVTITGDDQRSVKVSPSTTNDDIFHVRKGSKLANMTFRDHVAPACAVGFPTGNNIAENVDGGKWKGPYIQNCLSDTTTGVGIRVDGNQARSLKAINVDAFTQYNEGGIGVAVTNGGFAQLVSLFTICCQEAVTVDAGGQADIANSNCSFGTYGLVSRGASPVRDQGHVAIATAASQKEVAVDLTTPSLSVTAAVYDYVSGIATITVGSAHSLSVGMGVTLSGLGFTCTYGTVSSYPSGDNGYVFNVESVPSTTKFSVNVGVSTLAHYYSSGGTAKLNVVRPYDGQGVYFDTLYYEVEKINITNAGAGYTVTPNVIIAAPGGPTGTAATAYATLDGTSLKSITMINGGNQFASAPTVTIDAPLSGTTATATASVQPIYYTINSSTPVVSGITTVTFNENLNNALSIGATAHFSQLSRIIASSHTFEWVGSGNTIATATPKRGGVTIQANEVVTEDGGQVLYTSTDQAGNFRIGDNLQIDQSTGTISGRAFTKSLFSEMTPFILALS